MPLAGLVLNRVQTTALPGLPAARAWDAVVALEGLGDDEDDATAPEVLARGDDALAAGLLRLHAARMQRVEAEQALAAGFAARHPDVLRTQVPARPRDVHAVDDLRAVAEDLCAG